MAGAARGHADSGVSSPSGSLSSATPAMCPKEAEVLPDQFHGTAQLAATQ